MSTIELFTTSTYSLEEEKIKYNFHLGIKYSTSWISLHGYTQAGSAFLDAVLSLPVCQIRIGLRAADTNSVPGFADWFDQTSIEHALQCVEAFET